MVEVWLRNLNHRIVKRDLELREKVSSLELSPWEISAPRKLAARGRSGRGWKVEVRNVNFSAIFILFCGKFVSLHFKIIFIDDRKDTEFL